METGDLDDLIAAALAGYQQHLEQGAPVADTIGDDEPLPAAVADRLRRGKDCLELLVAIKHQSPRWTASTTAISPVALRRNSRCDTLQYLVQLLCDTTVAISSCCLRLSGSAGFISAPNVANA